LSAAQQRSKYQTVSQPRDTHEYFPSFSIVSFNELPIIILWLYNWKEAPQFKTPSLFKYTLVNHEGVAVNI
jgi:hypothetical protein